jgi:hypothetical protein
MSFDAMDAVKRVFGESPINHTSHQRNWKQNCENDIDLSEVNVFRATAKNHQTSGSSAVSQCRSRCRPCPTLRRAWTHVAVRVNTRRRKDYAYVKPNDGADNESTRSHILNARRGKASATGRHAPLSLVPRLHTAETGLDS